MAKKEQIDPFTQAINEMIEKAKALQEDIEEAKAKAKQILKRMDQIICSIEKPTAPK